MSDARGANKQAMSDARGANRRAGRRIVAALLVVAGLALASCTTVPQSSSPQVIKTLGAFDAGPAPIVAPPAGADPRSIVQGFLDANGANDPRHNSARSFLTTEGKSRWTDSTITVIDRPFTGNAVGGKVTVVGNEIGTIDESGSYTPSLSGDGTGTGGVQWSVSFGMKQVKKQWRIDSVQPNGLLISLAQFEQYQQRPLYFFDVSEEHLVPDPRFTELTDPRDLVVWLVARLAQGPKGGLSTALPDQTDPKRVRVEFPSDSASGGPTKIEIPGSSELDSANANRLAAQIAATLSQLDSPLIAELEITDGGVPVRIPAVRGTVFTAAQLAGQFPTPSPPSSLYYVHDGGVYQQSGRAMPGKVGTGAYGLSSVALTPRVGSDVLDIAGIHGAGKDESLDIGTSDQLVATKVHGELSRPAWAPDRSEVWIGSGSNLFRVNATGAVHAVPVDAVAGKPSGKITAVRLSPEGARVALVLTSPDGSSQVYVGAVVRGVNQVRVAALEPISPQGIAVTDVAWNDELKLFAIGTDRHSRAFGIYELQCDGSLWTPKPPFGLPQQPDSITVAANAVAAVSTDGTVWRQQAGGWVALQGDETRGSNPVYIE